MTAIALVAVRGTTGVLARYGLTLWLQSIWSVAAINLVGLFLLGLLVHAGRTSPTTFVPALGSASWAGSPRSPPSPTRPCSRPTAVDQGWRSSPARPRGAGCAA